MGNKYVFVIDTTDYAGNFEREMCAYVTGVVGECEVGSEFAEMYEEEMKQEESIFFEYLDHRCEEDDHGFARPAAIWTTPGWFNHGMGGVFREGEEAKALKDYVKQVTKYEEKEIEAREQIRFKLTQGETYSNWTVAACDREIKDCKRRITESKALKKPSKFPAYLSVAIFFHTKPTDEMIKLMKERALKFAAAKRAIAKRDNVSYEKNFKLNITGFRLIKESTKSVEEEV